MSAQVLYGLVLLGAIAHASWNGLLKGASDPFLLMAVIRTVGLLYGLTVVILLPPPPAEAWALLAAACIAHWVYFGLLLQSYRVGDMSMIYPIARGSAPVILAVGAYLSVDERLSTGQISGLVLSTVGLTSLGWQARRDWRPAGWALLTGISIAAYSLFGGLGVRATGSALIFAGWLEAIIGIGFVLLAIARRGAACGTFIRQHGVRGFVAGAISAAGFFAFLLAAQYLPLGPISAVRESSVIFGTLIGAIAFKEPFGRSRLLAAVLVTAGVALLALSGR